MFDVFVKVDSEGRIINISSSMYIDDTEGWTLIDSGMGDKYQLAGGNYFNKPIRNIMGIPVYKMEMGEIRERSEEEIRADIKAPEKTEIEKRIETIEKTVQAISDLLAKLGMK